MLCPSLFGEGFHQTSSSPFLLRFTACLPKFPIFFPRATSVIEGSFLIISHIRRSVGSSIGGNKAFEASAIGSWLCGFDGLCSITAILEISRSDAICLSSADLIFWNMPSNFIGHTKVTIAALSIIFSISIYPRNESIVSTAAATPGLGSAISKRTRLLSNQTLRACSNRSKETMKRSAISD